MHIIAHLRLPNLDILSRKNLHYSEQLAARHNEWVFLAGQEVYELVSRTGDVYVMQSSSRAVDRNLNVDQLPTLGTRLQPPPGWHYHIRTLDEDLVVTSHNDAKIVLDEFENNYQRTSRTQPAIQSRASSAWPHHPTCATRAGRHVEAWDRPNLSYAPRTSGWKARLKRAASCQ